MINYRDLFTRKEMSSNQIQEEMEVAESKSGV